MEETLNQEPPAVLEREVVKSTITLIKIRIERGTDGMLLKLAAAPLFEQHFTAMSKDPAGRILTGTSNLPSGTKFYNPVIPPVMRGKLGSLMAEPELGLFQGENVNLCFLRAVGIGTEAGLSIRMPVERSVYSTDRLRLWLQQFRDGAKEYYCSIIKPVQMEVEITTREI